MKTEVVDITPTMAAEMLASSTGNRNIRHGHVQYLAGAMARGEWRVTSNGIGFDATGALRDGHHRLNACIAAGVPFKTTIVYGLSHDAYSVTDCGIVRTLSDLAGIDRRSAQVLRLALELGANVKRPTAKQVNDINASPLGEAVGRLHKAGGKNSAIFSCAPLRLAAVIAALKWGDEDFSFGQYRALELSDYDAMTPLSKSFHKSAVNAAVSARFRKDRIELIPRGLMAFNPAHADKPKMIITELRRLEALDIVKDVVSTYYAGAQA